MNKNTSFSFELFPPRVNEELRNIDEILENLKDLNADFISVTFGAGGSKKSNFTLDIAQLIEQKYQTKSIVHLPCIHFSKEEIAKFLTHCKDRNLKNILALRGDMSKDLKASKDFSYASDLVEFIKQNGDFNIFGACYPETHNESKNCIEDIHNLKIKVDKGADKLITQLFFDNNDFYNFKQNCALSGIKAPIYAGIMPITNKRQILKITQLCGAKLPPKFLKILEKYKHNDKALADAGIAYAVDQIVDLITNGVDGIHLYIMNKAYVARRIYEATYSLFYDKIGA
ncbi:methylenetetrahydrofolate reductase [NAD(P)H] [Campylobacter sp. CCS1377]|uniref:Methylenetetrahydrofolate reductase n=1 Tax=Campylobacter sp. CCS1377 TaxID=3158229 RepID=A0AAU7E6U4_9BACT|nr:methylenetetrahydrofolate reductase [NAD(P)H] [Campylobacter jejuni]